MPNWHIEFEVTHKYFADAQAAIYSLRGTSNIAVRPIKEGNPRERVPHANGKMAGVEKLLNAHPETKFRTQAVAQATKDSIKLAGQKLAYLAKAKRIRRVAPGTYMALKAK